MSVDGMTWWVIDYSIATYEGTVQVRASENAEREHVIALAKQQLRSRSGGSLPFGAESYKIRRKDEE